MTISSSQSSSSGPGAGPNATCAPRRRSDALASEVPFAAVIVCFLIRPWDPPGGGSRPGQARPASSRSRATREHLGVGDRAGEALRGA